MAFGDEDIAIGSRLRKAIEATGKSIADVAGEASVPYKTLQRWLAGGPADAKGLARLARVTGTTLDHLVMGIGPESGDWETHLPPTGEGEVRIPVYDIALSAGPGIEALDRPPTSYAVFPAGFVRALGDPNELKLFPAVGDSMEPDIKDGELVIIHEGQARPRDGIVMARVGSDLLIKRMRLLGGGQAELVSSNPIYPPISINLVADDFEVIGKAVWAGKLLG